MAKGYQAKPKRRSRSQTLETLLTGFAEKLGKTEAQTEGAILLQINGPGGGIWSIESSQKKTRLVRGLGRRKPRAEIIGDAGAIRAVLEGKKEGRAAFLAGGIRVRGDISYLERISSELGMHSQ